MGWTTEKLELHSWHEQETVLFSTVPRAALGLFQSLLVAYRGLFPLEE
jgi:hypothetical protein